MSASSTHIPGSDRASWIMPRRLGRRLPRTNYRFGGALCFAERGPCPSALAPDEPASEASPPPHDILEPAAEHLGETPAVSDVGRHISQQVVEKIVTHDETPGKPR